MSGLQSMREKAPRNKFKSLEDLLSDAIKEKDAEAVLTAARDCFVDYTRHMRQNGNNPKVIKERIDLVKIGIHAECSKYDCGEDILKEGLQNPAISSWIKFC